MPTEVLKDISQVLPGIKWYQNGQTVLSEQALGLFSALDNQFLAFAARKNAQPSKFPVLISARELNKLDYFHSFPHLVTLAAGLDGSESNLARFVEGAILDEDGSLQLSDLAPVRDVLTPAACYHFYINYQGQELKEALYLTTCANCFRRESYYAPLQRQWSFNMREIVCLGTNEEVSLFLEEYQKLLSDYCKEIKLPVEFLPATDPFFRPNSNPKFIAQKLEPVKTEIVFAGQLAIGSLNFHRNFFGETFAINRDGKPVFSACVAFGLERFLYAFIATYGAKTDNYPLSFLGR